MGAGLFVYGPGRNRWSWPPGGACVRSAASSLLPFAEIITGATPAHQKEIVRHIVEKVVIADRAVVSVAARMEARPLFADFAVGQDDAWHWRPRTDAGAHEAKRSTRSGGMRSGRRPGKSRTGTPHS